MLEEAIQQLIKYRKLWHIRIYLKFMGENKEKNEIFNKKLYLSCSGCPVYLPLYKICNGR